MKETAIPIKNAFGTHKWTCHKLESFSEFINSYQPDTRKASFCYLELFTDDNIIPCRGIDCYFEGTPLRVLKSRAKFTRYGFLSPTRQVARTLEDLITPFKTSNNIEIFAGSQNHTRTLSRLLDAVPRSASSLVYIDPAGYRRLNWSTLEQLAVHGKNWQGEKAELLIVFPLEMALLRNLMRQECTQSLTRFFGNQRWEDIKRQLLLRKLTPEDCKIKLVELFKTGLFELGYRYVEDFRPASPTQNPYYHLIFTSDRVSRLKYLKESWGKPRFLKCELLYDLRARKSR